MDPYLTRWANVIHQERGVENVDCFTGDGTAGHPERASYDRLVAWCTPALLPDAWIDQLANGCWSSTSASRRASRSSPASASS
ncbi:hypothetical protein [Streptomyces sp. WZ-12]|uniref:hypothetical protein n=1 Tax=Streptomyces sp. WZ-12 TaxID=3030210 RepID=UPI00238103C7|nr:hypothetical protein [Streptomyces sp. WZ-12]